MIASPVRYDRWKAPAEDGQVLLWPPAADLLNDTRQNQQRLSAADSVLIQGVPLAQVRSRMRGWLGHDDAQPLIATGHQTELHHPGVWAKNALADAAATRLDGRAFHFAVDTDEPKHLVLRWPGGSVPLSDAPAAALEWSGLLPPPTPDHLQQIHEQFDRAAAAWMFRPLAGEFLTALKRLAMAATNLPPALTEALHQLDWNLGLRYDAMLVSPICLSEPYLLLVHHVLARAGQFASDYNAALDEFRIQNKIKAPGRPMPNLKYSEDFCEVPFWLDSLATGSRARAAVARSGGKWALQCEDGGQFEFDPSADGWEAANRLMRWLREHALRLSPRALTLTCVLRLLVADQFIHGIGGGLYDQVLDALIARHFGMEPPRFSVTTATLYFPDAMHEPRVCPACLMQEGRRLKHGMLGPRKRELVKQISALPRHSTERSRLFHQMHDQLSAAWALPPGRAWETRFRQAEAQAQEQKALFDRELFYAIQPRDRLMGLIDRYRQQI